MKLIEIYLNGEKFQAETTLNLEQLIRKLGLDPKWVVAELNGQALIKKDYPLTRLCEGDHLELVRAVSGG